MRCNIIQVIIVCPHRPVQEEAWLLSRAPQSWLAWRTGFGYCCCSSHCRRLLIGYCWSWGRALECSPRLAVSSVCLMERTERMWVSQTQFRHNDYIDHILEVTYQQNIWSKGSWFCWTWREKKDKGDILLNICLEEEHISIVKWPSQHQNTSNWNQH